jgi:D-amino-acid dehydrogenase
MTHVAVVGGGLVGLTIVHALLDDGHAVTVVDPGDQPGRPSDGNAGWIAHVDILPLASAKAWRNLPRWLADPLGPLSIRPAYLPAVAPWLLRFALASRPAQVERSTLAIRALNAGALPAWRRRLAALGLTDKHLRERGQLSVFPSRAAARAALPLFERQRGLGIRVEALDGGDLRDVEPVLGPAAEAGALYPDVCHVSDPRLLGADLASATRQRGAARLPARAVALEAEGEGVLVRLADGGALRVDRAVVAAGAWSRPLAATLGDRVPLDTERGYNVTLPPGTLGLSRPTMFEGEGFVASPLDTGDRVGGAVEFAGLDAPPNHARTDAMLARLRRYLPRLPAPLPEGPRWMGFRPSLPDSLPVIGRASRTDRVIYAFGHAHHGLTQSAVTAEIVAAQIDGRAPPVDPAPYAVTRF